MKMGHNVRLNPEAVKSYYSKPPIYLSSSCWMVEGTDSSVSVTSSSFKFKLPNLTPIVPRLAPPPGITTGASCFKRRPIGVLDLTPVSSAGLVASDTTTGSGTADPTVVVGSGTVGTMVESSLVRSWVLTGTSHSDTAGFSEVAGCSHSETIGLSHSDVCTDAASGCLASCFVGSGLGCDLVNQFLH
jgi:hypothetical protein